MARRGGGRRQSGGILNQLPLKLGAVFGIAAYVVGYVLTYVLVELDGDIDTSGLDGEFADTIDLVGWVFYNGHFVDTKSSVTFGSNSQSESQRLIAEGSTQIPEVVYYLVPIVLLIGAGYLLLQQSYVNDGLTAVLAGASVVVGYLPLAVLGTFLFEASESYSQNGFEASASIGPEMMTGILLAGLIFPVLLGAVGGLLGFVTQDNRGGGMRR